jgi:NADPH:quinone reductase-like Zn-dependent oxidoreductase
MKTVAVSAMAPPATMVAARLHVQGGPDAIVVEETPTPALRRGDALVAVEVVAITPSELGWASTWTHPDGSGRTPVIPAHEVAGTVAAAAADVASNVVGRPVFGLADFDRDGAAAQYVAVHAADLAERPARLPAAQAAALSVSALTAWQALFDAGALASRGQVLVHGAAGAVGSFVVQLAHWAGARVIAVGSGRDLDYLRGLGADEVLDRHAVAFEASVSDVDLVIDTVGGDVVDRSWSVLGPAGRIVSIAPSAQDIARRDPRGRFFVVRPDPAELEHLAALVIEGTLRVVLDRTFPLEQAGEAYAYAIDDHPRGKVLLTVG